MKRTSEKVSFYISKKKGKCIEMFGELILFIGKHSFFIILLYAVLMDTILGVLRAVKEHKFNSCVGIDGAIRKVAMLISICFLMGIDMIAHINVLSLVPQQYVQFLGVEKLGLSEFFALMDGLYEAVSILKNAALCGLPVPVRVRNYIQKFLEDMTEELPD